jgi:hypothetical protein
MSTLVNGNTGTVFSDLRQQAHSYVAPEYDEDRLDVEEIAGIPLVVTDYALYPSKFDADRKFIVMKVTLADDRTGTIVNSGAALIPQLTGQQLPLYVPGGLQLGRNGKTWRLVFNVANEPDIDPDDIPF